MPDVSGLLLSLSQPLDVECVLVRVDVCASFWWDVLCIIVCFSSQNLMLLIWTVKSCDVCFPDGMLWCCGVWSEQPIPCGLTHFFLNSGLFFQTLESSITKWFSFVQLYCLRSNNFFQGMGIWIWNSVMIYSPSCCTKSVWSSFCRGTLKEMSKLLFSIQ